MKLGLSLFGFAICSLLLFSCSSHRLQGNGHVKSKSISLAHFHRLRLNGDFNVRIRTASTQGVQLSGDSNLLKYVDFKVKQGFLTISMKPGQVVTTRHPFVLNLAMRHLYQLELIGSSRVTYQHVASDRLIVNVDGGGSVTVNGKATDLDINMIGTGRVDARELAAKDCELNMVGAGKAWVFATKKLSVNVSGAAQVRYYGRPTVHSVVSGAASCHAVG